MKYFNFAALLAGLYLVVTVGCASQLKREKTINTPEGSGVEEELDFSKIYFNEVYTGVQFSVLDYMKQSGRDHLLLMFGSRGCSACNEKNEKFKKSIIGQHQFFLTDQGKKFEVVGVNTDSDSVQQLRAYLTNYEFIRWSDPKGQNMVSHFVPPGRKFGVPVTVLINKKGIVFRILNDEKASPDQIMARVQEAILKTPTDGGSTDGVATDGGDDDGGGDGGGVVVPKPVPATDLAYIGPGRFKKVEIKTCDNTPTTLDDALGQPDFRIVHVTRGACGGDCSANLVELKKLETAVCSAPGAVDGTNKCTLAALQTEAPGAGGEACAAGFTYAGGSSFFDVFATHFNWNYPLKLNLATYLPEFTKTFDGPMTLVFRRDGALVWSREGKLASAGLQTEMMGAGFGFEFADGPAFPVYTTEKKIVPFSAIRKKSKLTIVAATLIFDQAPCSSCEVEIGHWSKPGGFVDFCQAHPADCQIMMFDTKDPRGTLPIGQLYDLIVAGGGDPTNNNAPVAGLAARGLRVPLYLDPIWPHSDPDGNDNMARLKEGYLTAVSPVFAWSGRVAIWNQEGRLLQVHESGMSSPDEIFEFVKKHVENQ